MQAIKVKLAVFGLAVLGLAVFMPPSAVCAAETAPLKIGIIGAGRIGGTLAQLWVQAGHEVLISSRHPDELKPLAQSLGPKARVGTPSDAATFGDVVLISIPYGALPQVGHDLSHELAGKIVLDTGNPYPERDGDMANEARRKGTGVASAEYLPGVRLVRAFNAINYKDLPPDGQAQLAAQAGIKLNPEELQAKQDQDRQDSGVGSPQFDPRVRARRRLACRPNRAARAHR